MSHSVESFSYLVTILVGQAIGEVIIWSFGQSVTQSKSQKVGQYSHCVSQ